AVLAPTQPRPVGLQTAPSAKATGRCFTPLSESFRRMRRIVKMDPTFRHKFGRQMTTLSAATLLLMSAPAFSQSTAPQQVDPVGQASGNKITQDFSQVDKNQDQKLSWDEVESELREPLSQANLNEEQVLSRFDRDQNNSLDEEEFRLLVSQLNQSSSKIPHEGQAAQQGGQQSEIV